MKRSSKRTEKAPKTPSGILAVQRIRDDSVRALAVELVYDLASEFPSREIPDDRWDRRRWDESVSFVARYLDYPSADAFLEDCGFELTGEKSGEEEDAPRVPDLPFALERRSAREQLGGMLRRVRQECRKRPILIPMALLAAMLLLSAVLMGIFVLAGRAVVSAVG